MADASAQTQGTHLGLLGRKLSHSWSPRIHSYFCDMPYTLVELEPDELGAYVRGNRDWQGLNVTIPYKQDVMAFADELGDAAKRLGAANTLVRRADGSIFADNTDLYGFTWMLERFCTRELGAASARDALKGKEVLVLGSGGASKSVRAALVDCGAWVSTISRSGPDNYENLLERHATASLIVNTTPVGMYPECPATPVDVETLRAMPSLLGVLDVVYNPTVTGICLAAEELGLPWASGLSMLVAQALRSNELFLDTVHDPALIEKIEADLLSEMKNIVFIGMPGAGKTSTAKRVARALGRPFIDMDCAVTISCGITPAEYITQHGEDAFRKVETVECEKYGKSSGLVIACGGGVVTRPENYALLHQNGTILMLDRPLDQLSVQGRPLSQGRGVEVLAQERMPIYRAWADYIIDCCGTSDGDAIQARQLLGLSVEEEEV